MRWCPPYPHPDSLSIHDVHPEVPGDPNPTPYHIGNLGYGKHNLSFWILPPGSGNKESYLFVWDTIAVEFLKLMFPESLKVSTSVFSSCLREPGQGQLPPPTWLKGLAAAHSENSRCFVCKSHHEQRLTYTPWHANVAQRCFQVPGLGGEAGVCSGRMSRANPAT